LTFKLDEIVPETGSKVKQKIAFRSAKYVGQKKAPSGQRLTFSYVN
jgi:hypothetical protein